MNTERLVAGLDVGSTKTTAILAEVEGDLPKHPSIKILGVGQAKTTGVHQGMVSDIEETTRSIKKAMQDAERMAGIEAEEVFCGMAGEHAQAMISKGIVAVSHDEIDKSDVDRVNEVARAQAIPQDRELLHAIPQEYTVDRNSGIRDPIGMSGTRLETEMYLVTIGSSPPIHLRRSVELDQPYGLLHGGASVLLAETLGSSAGNLCVEADALCVGIEINANHLAAVREGIVTGTARALHVGRSTQVWEIRIEDEDARLVCISRLTLAVVQRRQR